MAQEIENIPFKVSARTARLIGRENVATFKGAIIELVKNCYDADSDIAIIYFDNLYSVLKNHLSIEEFNETIDKIDSVYTERTVGKSELETDILSLEKIKKIELFKNAYFFESDEYRYKLTLTSDESCFLELKELLKSLASLYIIDNGDGMTDTIIRNHWMTIGTDNKYINYKTQKSRIKAGAKGIGRFALDKLGSLCEMTTFINKKVHSDFKKNHLNGFLWRVNWEDFEGVGKSLNTVTAQLMEISKEIFFSDELSKILPPKFKKIIKSSIEESTALVKLEHGTILKITGLRDEWHEEYTSQVFSDLEVLTPIEESNVFKIFLYTSLNSDKYGEVSSFICDDFDYKLVAEADDEQNVNITIYRNEYDINKIPKAFFKRKKMLEPQFTEEVFRNGKWQYNRSFSNLLPGYKNIDHDDLLSRIGKFKFTFYYLKRQFNKLDQNRFFYKDNTFKFRKEWLDTFGGIKIFRDFFRVRPYGETKDVAFDWLGLGSRKAKSPAGIAKSGRGYRVEPENIAGSIIISRIGNIDFEDKSSREGLQENATFNIFKQLIISLIREFEQDRSDISQEFESFYSERYATDINRKEAEKIAERLSNELRIKRENKNFRDINQKADTEKDILINLYEETKEKLEQTIKEMQLLRGMASSGIVIAAFTHDLSKINGDLDERVDLIKLLFSEKVNEDVFTGSDESENPYYWLKKMKEQDIKIKNWLQFSLSSARKDKRKRIKIILNTYFKNLADSWQIIFKDRGIRLNYSIKPDISIKAFEIDLDSIFNNLISNSIEAFNIAKFNHNRIISIEAFLSNNTISIIYSDSGDGLSKDLIKPEIIFEPLFTTTRNSHTGEENGTGLGMWIVKSIVEDNNGEVTLLFPKEGGFSLKIDLLIK